LSDPVVMPETRVRSVNVDLPVPSEALDLPERRANPAVTDNQDPRVLMDQWASADLQACLVSRVLKDTGVCPVPTAQRELRDNRVSQETSESQVPSVSPVQWVPVAPAVSAVASDPQDPRVFVVATDFQAQAVLLVPLDPRVPQESPASPDPRETKDSKDPREALAFKDLAERTDCLDLLENREFKELPVWTAPTERKVPAETWASKAPLDSPDPEALLVLPETLEWLVPRVSRDNLVFLDSAV